MGNTQAEATKKDVVPAVTSEAAPKPEDNYPKFLSTTGDVIYVGLLSGHTIAISPDDPTPLHPRFHREATIKGAMPETVARNLAAIGGDVGEQAGADRRDVIMSAISTMVEQAERNPELLPKLFTAGGEPDANVLSERCGFVIRKAERDKMWEEYQGEIA